MKLLICVPTLDYVHSEFMKCLSRLIIKLKDTGVDFDLEIISGTLVYVARDRLAKRAINKGYTHTLWLDSDMVFTDDLLDDIRFSGKDFVTGIYHTRRPPHVSCIFKDIDLDNIDRYDDCDYPKDTFEIAGCGFGCVWLSTQVLADVYDRFGEAFTPMQGLGEDIAFCKRAKACGHHIYCEPSVRLGHIGHITIYPEDHARWKAAHDCEDKRC